MNATAQKKSAPRSYGGLSETERMQERRERFLAAGLEVFGTIGLRKATVKTLCKAAALTERYFYESFEDTEALFSAVYQREHENLGKFFVTALPELPESLEDRINAALDLYFTAMKDAKRVRVLYVESSAGSPRLSNEHYSMSKVFAQLSGQLIRSDNPDIEVSEQFAATVGLAINGATTNLATQWMLSGYEIPQEVVVKSCSLLVLGTMKELKNLPKNSV